MVDELGKPIDMVNSKGKPVVTIDPDTNKPVVNKE